MIDHTAIPSRDSNPFATCWTRPGALPYLPTASASLPACLERLAQTGGRGQIVGPHGVGKSTLLRAIARTLAADGRQTTWVTGGGPPPREGEAGVMLIDGFERLGPWRRRQWRRQRRPLIVTCHRPLGLPTLAVLAPTLADVLACFERLVENADTTVTADDAADAFARHGGNVRETWFSLYDLHERRRRANPPAARRVGEGGKECRVLA